jgi:hypothetical protein
MDNLTQLHCEPSVTQQSAEPSVTSQSSEPSVTSLSAEPSVTSLSAEPSVTSLSAEPSVTHVLLSNSSSAISYFLSKFEPTEKIVCRQRLEALLSHGICALWLGSLHCELNYEETITSCFSANVKAYHSAEKYFSSDFFQQNFYNYWQFEINLVSVFDHAIRSKKIMENLRKCKYENKEINIWYDKFSEFLNLQALFIILKKVLYSCNFDKNILRNDKNKTTKENDKFSIQFDSPILYYIQIKKQSNNWKNIFLKNDNRTWASQNENFYCMSKYILLLRNLVQETWERVIYPRDDYISPAETGDFMTFHNSILHEINCIQTHVKEPYFIKKNTWTQTKWDKMKESVYDDDVNKK